ncbi:reverse transcriptase domain-containing protein [Tanacetum coccineum]|uniref:Reverse transcriptase domain-containing protein n=1 Tax=Tanacetum coccineum TaxID=301880 RepID=A0ABQ5ITZ0_9ASTR
MLNKFIDEGKREHEEMRTFIYDFQTTNELLFKERNNSLIELRFGVQELLKVINNVLMIDCDVKGVTTRGGKTTTQDVHDNNTNVLPKEPIVVELENPVGPNDVLTNDQPQMTSEPVVQPSNKVQTPFPRILRKEKEEAQQKKFLENLKQLHINLPFIEALAQMPKPFLATARVMIDVFNKKITLRVGDDEVIFDVDQSIKRPTTKDDECYGIDDLDDTINEDAQELLTNEESDSFLSRGLEKSIDQSDLECCESASSNGNNESDLENSVHHIVSANTPCMTAIFHDMVEDFMEVFMDDFSVFGSSFDCCLANLDRMLARWQRIDGKFKSIYYASKTLNNAQEHYTTTEKELLAVVFSFDKFRPYLILSKIDKKGVKNLAADHLSRLENPDLGTFTKEEITNEFPNEHLMILKAELNNDEPWYADYVNYIVGKFIPPNWTPKKRRRFVSQVKNYFWDEPYAFKLCSDNVMRRCIDGNKILEILGHYHSGPTEGHHNASITRRKVYGSGFYWPSIFKDDKDYVMRYDACQRSGNISSRNEMPQNNIQLQLLSDYYCWKEYADRDEIKD